VDLQIGEEPYDPVNMEEVRREKELEVRMLIKKVDNISIFRDFGERNDVKVEGKLIYENFYGTIRTETFHTDVHAWANEFASFNYRWVFKLRVPLAYARMEFRLLDEDTITLGGAPKEVIYDTVSYSLDRVLANFRDVAGDNHGITVEEPMKLQKERVIFSRIAEEDKGYAQSKWWLVRLWYKLLANLGSLCIIVIFKIPELCQCGGKIPTIKEDLDAVMQLEVEVWPVKLAERDPVGQGHKGPHAPPPPDGRVSWAYFAQHPGKLWYKLIGPTNYELSRVLMVYLVFVIIFLLVSYVVYMGLNSWVPLAQLLWYGEVRANR
jgi:hypothetical protein